MKNYIGVKIVKAEPMEKDGKAGYKVGIRTDMSRGLQRSSSRRRTGNLEMQLISSTQNSSGW